MAAIASERPVTVNTTFDRWWIRRVLVDADNPLQPDGKERPVRVTAIFARYDGMRIDTTTRVYQLNDLYALAASDPESAQVMGLFIAQLGRLAPGAGVIE